MPTVGRCVDGLVVGFVVGLETLMEGSTNGKAASISGGINSVVTGGSIISGPATSKTCNVLAGQAGKISLKYGSLCNYAISI